MEVYVRQLFLLLMCVLDRIQYTTVYFKLPDATGLLQSLTISVKHIHKFITIRRTLLAQLAPSFKPGVRETNKFKIEYVCKFITNRNKIMRRQNVEEKALFYWVESTQKPIPVVARSKAWVCGRLLAGIAGSNPVGGLSAFLL